MPARAGRRGRSHPEQEADTDVKLTGRWRYLRLASLMIRLPYYSRVIWGLTRDPRVPLPLKGLLMGALAYVVMPFDLIPDAIPIVGRADDLTVVLLTLDLFIHNAPAAVRAEHMSRAHSGTADLDADLARLRGLLGDRYEEIRDSLPHLLEQYGELRSPLAVQRLLAGWRRRRLQERDASANGAATEGRSPA
jgi:uncharacterized membrane protein YkvA (DUF1232 family)